MSTRWHAIKLNGQIRDGSILVDVYVVLICTYRYYRIHIHIVNKTYIHMITYTYIHNINNKVPDVNKSKTIISKTFIFPVTK